MTTATDKASLDQWYVIETEAAIPVGTMPNRLLGVDLEVTRAPDGAITVMATGRDEPLPTKSKFGFLWTTLGTPERDIFPVPETDEADRRYVPCGAVSVKASGLRIIENFLDMAHFPFVHTDILGSEPHTEVPQYLSEIRRDVDEVWATNCTFFQPRIAATESNGDFVHLTYRVPTPFVVMLYRVCPTAPDRLDAIALFIRSEERRVGKECRRLCRSRWSP
jgi:phenylpropionate dioxygenase-like ring-hydroxylating dioxygenase large terminal subunit